MRVRKKKDMTTVKHSCYCFFIYSFLLLFSSFDDFRLSQQNKKKEKKAGDYVLRT